MWNLTGPGVEPMSPALTGVFLTTATPGKSYIVVLLVIGKNWRQLQYPSIGECRSTSWYIYVCVCVCVCLVCVCVCVCVLVAQLCLTLCDTMDCSLPGSSTYGILQARILEWVAIPFSRGSSQPRDWTWVSHIAGTVFIIWTTRKAHTME